MPTWPSGWRASGVGQQDSSGWLAHWNTVSSKPRVFAVEARDYVDRLCNNVPIRKTDVILDFGCGFGYVATRLADRAAHVDIWDNAANVRAQALQKTACVGNIGYANFLDNDDPKGRYDTIVVHSVIQYIMSEELGAWLERWRVMLKPGGQLVISDVLQEPGGSRAEIVRLMKFSARNGFFFDSFISGIREIGRYSRTRGATDLGVTPPEALGAMAKQTGYNIRTLAENLSYRSVRYTAVLRPGEPGRE